RLEIDFVPIEQCEKISPAIAGNPRSARRLARIQNRHVALPIGFRGECAHPCEQLVAVHPRQVAILRWNKTQSAHGTSPRQDTPSLGVKTRSNLSAFREPWRGGVRVHDSQPQSDKQAAIVCRGSYKRTKGNSVHRRYLSLRNRRRSIR